MSTQNRVVWNEGLFIKPQHFQQESRHFDYLLNQNMTLVSEYLFGFSNLEINREFLNFGKIGLLRASGRMADGTLFDIPNETPEPTPLTINQQTMVGQRVYLAIPLRSVGSVEMQWPGRDQISRYVVEQSEVKDLHSEEGNHAAVHIARFNARLMLESEDRSAYVCLAITQITELQADNSVSIDEDFYPTSVSLNAITPLSRFLGEVTGLMRERAKMLASRVGNPSQSGVADFSDFMFLQSLNRMYPYFKHLSRIQHLHPETLYGVFASACGELVTFEDDSRLPDEYPAYQHEDPRVSFVPLIKVMRRVLSQLMQAKAISIPIFKEQYGTWAAPVHERELLQSADFILAVRSSTEVEKLHELFAQQAKVGSIEQITELIKLQLPGIPLTPLPVAPRNLPYHAGFIYFQLNRNNTAWDNMMQETAGFGFHITGSLPELEFELWAIRNK
ncbi:MAG: type VI secretion system baseplate subunit TssK [Methylococcaceae bacterium]